MRFEDETTFSLLDGKRWRRSWQGARRDVKGVMVLLFLSITISLVIYMFVVSGPVASGLLPGAASGASNQATYLPAQFFTQHKSQRLRVRAGPYSVPGVAEFNGMKSYNVPLPPPCSDCLITWMQAGLEYPDGSYANADTGMWLHHVVLINMNGSSTVCPRQTTRFFASGNERTPVDICVNGTEKAGYYIAPDTSIGMSVELMNMKTESRDVVLTFTYEYITGPIPADFSQVRVLWLDIGGCKNSELPVKADPVFQYSSPKWTSASTKGRIVFTGSHLHDGGTRLTVVKNGKEICDSVAGYGQSAGYISTPSSMDMTMDTHMTQSDMLHISSMSVCTEPESLAVGDTISITAYYDTSRYPPMTNMDGSLEGIMGISVVYVAENL